MSNVFISHADRDSRVAIRLAEGLQELGFSTWYYERDSVPGPSYLTQCREAIECTQSMLLIISEDSVRSHEVNAELEMAHGANLPILPLRMGMSNAEFKSRRPNWGMVLGTRVSVELHPEMAEVALRSLEEGLRRLDVSPERALPAKPVAARPPTKWTKDRAWPSDANQIDIRNLDSIVFSNGLIDEFLNSESKYFLSANKGLGKTLLLTYKRSRLEREESQGGRSGCFVPTGRPYLDFMSDLQSVKKANVELLADGARSKALWSFALKVSALSCHPALFRDEDADDLQRLPRRVRDWLAEGSRIEPTMVFKEMLDLSRSDINRAIDRAQNFLEQKYRRIHSGTYLFIDKVDQGCKGLPRDAWVAVQSGLIEAAWDLLNSNNHVKIYASIRQEAFSNYESDIKVNLYGATTIIKYTREDLSDLLDRLSQVYEGTTTIKEFIGLNVVKHPMRAFPEDSFEYMRRYTLGRPRDFVILASAFSRMREQSSQPAFCRQVAETSGAVLVSNVFSEMKVFLSCLTNRERRLQFLARLPHNIISRREAVEIWSEFNDLDAEDLTPEVYRDIESFDHPFWELYSAGLLGIVTQDDTGHAVQRFKQPHDQIHDSQSALPHVDYYLIHPALSSFIRSQRSRGVFNVFQSVVVGHDCAWEDHNPTFCRVERLLFELPDTEFRGLAFELLKEISVRKGMGASLRADMDACATWKAIRSHAEGDDAQAEVVMWLEDLFEAGQGAAAR